MVVGDLDCGPTALLPNEMDCNPLVIQAILFLQDDIRDTFGNNSFQVRLKRGVIQVLVQAREYRNKQTQFRSWSSEFEPRAG